MNEKIQNVLKLRQEFLRVSEDVRARDDINGAALVGAAATKWLDAQNELNIPEAHEYVMAFQKQDTK